MGEHILDVVLHRLPEVDAVRVFDVLLRATEQVPHEVRQNVDSRFSKRNGREVIVGDMGNSWMFCMQVQFPPGHVINLSHQAIQVVDNEYPPLKLDPLLVMGLLNDMVLQRLLTKSTRGATLVVIHEGRYPENAPCMLLPRIPLRMRSVSVKHKRGSARGARTLSHSVSLEFRLDPEWRTTHRCTLYRHRTRQRAHVNCLGKVL